MSRVIIPERRILLPQELDHRLKTLAGLEQETSGVLLYRSQEREQGLELMIDALYMTGRGTRLSVEKDSSRQDVIDRFILIHPDYGSIECHTHVTGNTELSNTDLEYFKREIAQNPWFIGMIVTRNKYKLIAYGKGEEKTSIQVVQTPSDFSQRGKYVGDEISKAVRRLGHSSFTRFKATKRV